MLFSLPPEGGTTNIFPEAFAQTQKRTTNQLSILPANSETEVGQRIQLKIIATDERGRQTEFKAGYWIALPNEAATIDADGQLSVLAPGEIQIVAIVNGKQVRTSIRVKPARVASIQIAKPTAPLLIGESLKLTAKASDASGALSKDAKLDWASDNPTVAAVDANGQVIGLAVGKAKLTARAQTVSDNFTIEIVKSDVHSLSLKPHPTSVRVGDVIHFSAEAKTETGAAASFAKALWSTDGAAMIEPNGSFVGAFVAQRPGSFTVTASAGGKSASTTIAVAARNVSRELETIARISMGANPALEFWPFGNFLYVAMRSDELRVYDLSDPKTPRLTETLKVDARSLPDFSLTPDGRIGVLTREGASNRQNGLLFLDTSDPAHPKIMSSFTETISGSIHSAFIDGHYVFLTDDTTGSMRVIDFRDVRNPKQVARWELALPTMKSQHESMAGMAMAERHLHDVQVKDGLAYLAYWRDGLVILDVGAGLRGGSPENPKLVSQFRFNHADLYGTGWIAGTREVFRHKNYVFVGDEVIPTEFNSKPPPGSESRKLGRGMLHVIDVSDIYHPRRVAEYSLPEGGAYNVWVEGDQLAMGFYGGGGRALDISGELRGNLAEQSREIARLPIGLTDNDREAPFTFGARIFGDYLLFNDFKTGVWITRLGKAK